MPLARGRSAFRTNVLLTLGAYALYLPMFALGEYGVIETCGLCALIPLTSLVTTVLASIALLRARELRALLRWGHAALAGLMWFFYGVPGILFASEPNNLGDALGVAFAAFGMLLGLFSVVPGYLGWVWLSLRLWPRPPPAPVERAQPPVEIGPAPAKRETTFELMRRR